MGTLEELEGPGEFETVTLTGLEGSHHLVAFQDLSNAPQGIWISKVMDRSLLNHNAFISVTSINFQFCGNTLRSLACELIL